jgi:hypothetical protein
MLSRRVALLAPGSTGDAPWALLSPSLREASARVTLDDLTRATLEFDVLWVHAQDEPPPLPVEGIMAWVNRGGRLLLTQRAATRVVALGLESDGPNDTSLLTWRDAADELWLPQLRSAPAFPRVRGLAALGPHPLFVGLGLGTFVWAPVEGETVAQATYARGKRPGRGAVVACERSYLHINADRCVAWEYAVGQGGVLCVGAFVVPDARDPLLEPQLSRVLHNALAGEAIPHEERSEPAAVWPKPGRTAGEDPNLVLPDPVRSDGPLPGLGSPLHVWSRAQQDEPFVLAGRRAMTVGGEQHGVGEIWVHPYRILQHLTVTIDGEAPLVRDTQITPSLVQRHLVTPTRIVEEAISVALEHPIVFLDYRPEKIGRARGQRAGAELSLRWRVDLRRGWPYPAGCGGDLRYRLAPGGRTLLVTDATGMPRAAFQPSAAVDWWVYPDPESPVLHCQLRIRLDAPFRLTLYGGSTRMELEAAVATMARRGARGLSSERERHETQLREQLARIRCPEESVNRAFEWAKVRLDAFLVEAPGVGRAVVAGYAASRPGWGDGRPGYAWYVGRDACWTAMALLEVGDTATCRLVLRLLGATQDLTGETVDELATNGLAHYGATDATPLYLLLAGRYAAWTGDLAFLAERWPELERACRFCLSTDGDGLPVKNRLGHDWVEAGPLPGAHRALYRGSVWVAALRALAPVARALGHRALADELAQRIELAGARLASLFGDVCGNAHGRQPGDLAQPKPTALTAVALWLGAVDPESAAGWFTAISSSAFSTPWGVRLISRDDPVYSPRGYHTGAVWPLYSGLASLAEYAGHRPEAGFAHLMANARLPFARGQGMFDEVLDGDTGAAAGACPDQAWSAAMLVAPLIEGILGARPDAMNKRLRLTPHLPAAWNECEWRGLRVGQTTLDLRLRREPHGMVVLARRIAGEPIDLVAAPALPAGSVVTEAHVDGEVTIRDQTTSRSCRHVEVTLQVRADHEVRFGYRDS